MKKIGILALILLAFSSNVATAEDSSRQLSYGEYKGVYNEKSAKSMAVTVAKNKAYEFCRNNGWRRTRGFKIVGSEAFSYGNKMFRGEATVSFYCSR